MSTRIVLLVICFVSNLTRRYSRRCMLFVQFRLRHYGTDARERIAGFFRRVTVSAASAALEYSHGRQGAVAQRCFPWSSANTDEPILDTLRT